VVAIAGRLFPQNAADDPGGWTKAKWGMTQEQIKEAFPETTEIQEMNEMHLGLSMSVINHRKFAVAFTSITTVDSATPTLSIRRRWSEMMELRRLLCAAPVALLMGWPGLVVDGFGDRLKLRTG